MSVVDTTKIYGDEVSVAIAPGYGCVLIEVEIWGLANSTAEREDRCVQIDPEDIDRIIARLRRAKTAAIKRGKERDRLIEEAGGDE